MTWREDLVKKLRWLFVWRIVVFTSIIAISISVTSKIPYLMPFILFYAGGTLAYLLAIFFWSRIYRKITLNFIFGVQFAIEIIVVAFIVHYTGGVTSHLLILFIFSIISASFIFELAGTLLFATLATFAHGALVYLEYKGIMPVDNNSYNSFEVVFTRGYINVCLFYILAFSSGYLSKNLRMKLQRVQELEKQLDLMRFDTKQVLEHMRNGLLSINSIGSIIFFNEAAEKILELKQNRVKGRFFKDVLPDRINDLTETIEDMYKKELDYNGPKKSHKEIQIKDESGRKIELLVLLSLLEIEDGRRGIIILMEDITQLKLMRQHLQDVEKLAEIGELSANMAHEIRNPLASIRSSVEIMGSSVEVNPENKKLMGLVIKESDRLSNLLKEFLTIARVGEIPAKQILSKKVDIVKLIGGIINSFDQTIAPEMKFKHSASDEHIYVKGREDQLEALFYNLIKNAVEATNDGNGEIKVQYSSHSGDMFTQETYVQVSISDTGEGIEIEQYKDIFKPFYSTKRNGTGLGLAIARRIVDQHMGYIEVKENDPQGAIFNIRLLACLENNNKQETG